MEIKQLHELFLKCSSVSIDTRNITDNSLFIAIKGERFDANTFTKEALEKGAKYVIIDNAAYHIDHRTVLVNDSLQTLQELAAFHRKYLNLPIIALTGSNGKTTTKELIAAVLSKKYNTKATIGNYNNHIGVPLTLLSFNKKTEIGIVEMGANHQKEIEFLCKITQPDFGYITNFGKAHLEGFGGFEGVIKGKSELYTYLKNNHKKTFINYDDKLQKTYSQEIENIGFSITGNEGEYHFSNPETNPFASIYFDNQKIQSNLIGIYNISNICAAISIGLYFNVNPTEIKSAIESYFPTNNRSQIIKQNNNQIILDAYNANPSSMKAAIENFIKLKEQNKILILGDMFELGEESIAEHKKIIDLLIPENNLKKYFVGNHFYKNHIENETTKFFENYEDLQNHIKDHSFKDSFFLIKGSRGMALERILEFIKPENIS